MHVSPRLRRRAAAALAATTFLVMASVGSCQMPQPKFPTLGATSGTPRTAAVDGHPRVAMPAAGRVVAAASAAAVEGPADHG